MIYMTMIRKQGNPRVTKVKSRVEDKRGGGSASQGMRLGAFRTSAPQSDTLNPTPLRS